jgi:methionyl-tRNA formyltransferase
MKILVLTGSSDRHFYFINQVVDKISCYHQVYVILNAKRSSISNTLGAKIIQRLIKYRNNPRIAFQHLRQLAINIFFYPFLVAVKTEYSTVSTKFFGGQYHQYLMNKHRISGIWDALKDLPGINSAETHEIIKEVNPDITMVMGTCLISKKTIESCGYVVNLHTGLSPYYKGGNSNFWPIYHRYNNLTGYTLHEMTTGIDSGPIIASDIIQASECNFSYPHVNSLAIIKGVESLCEIISRKSLPTSTQQWEAGRCFNNSDFDGYCCLIYLGVKWLLNNAPLFQPNNQSDVRII